MLRQSRLAHYQPHLWSKALVLVTATVLEIFQPHLWSKDLVLITATVVEIFQPHLWSLCSKALVLITATVQEIFQPHLWSKALVLVKATAVMPETGRPGEPLAPQYLVVQLTLFQPGRTDYPHLLLLAPPMFFPFLHHCTVLEIL